MIGKIFEKLNSGANLSKYYENLDQAEQRLDEVKGSNADVNVNQVIDVVRGVANDDLTKQCFAKYKDSEHDKDPMKSGVTREMNMFIINALNTVNDPMQESSDVPEKTIKLLSFVLNNELTEEAYGKNPDAVISHLHSLAHDFQDRGGFALLQTLEKNGFMQETISNIQDNNFDFASEFFEKISKDSDLTEEAVVESLRDSESFQIACQNGRFLYNIRNNNILRAGIVADVCVPSSMPISDREPM